MDQNHLCYHYTTGQFVRFCFVKSDANIDGFTKSFKKKSAKNAFIRLILFYLTVIQPENVVLF
jgi:hypothetical protein